MCQLSKKITVWKARKVRFYRSLKNPCFSMCESDDSSFWNAFLFSIAFFQLENPFFRKRWVCIRWSQHSTLKCFQASMATSRISTLVMIQPLKSFKPCCSYSRSSLPGMDYLIRLQRLDLEGWVVSLSFPVCQLLFWRAANHFHFRAVLWFGLFLRLHQALCH